MRGNSQSMNGTKAPELWGPLGVEVQPELHLPGYMPCVIAGGRGASCCPPSSQELLVRGLLSESHTKRLGHSTDYMDERCARTACPSGVETTSVTVSHAEDGASLLGTDLVFNYDLLGKALLSTLSIRWH